MLLVNQIADVISYRDVNNHLSDKQEERLANVIYKVSFKNNISVSLILSVIEEESMYNPSAVSNKQCVGLMQLDKRTSAEIAKKHNFGYYTDLNIEHNIILGVRYLTYLHAIYKKWPVTLTVYNVGMGTFKKNKKINKYAINILKKQKTIERLLW